MADTSKVNKIDFKNTKVYISDKNANPGVTPAVGAISGNIFEIEFGDGDFQWTVAKQFEYNLDRGRLDSVRLGDEVPMDISFEGKFNYIKNPSTITATAPPTIYEALMNPHIYAAFPSEVPTSDDTISGYVMGAQNWLSASEDVDPCGPWSVNLWVENTPLCSTGQVEANELILFKYFRAESCQFSLKNGTISVSGKSNVSYPVAIRA